MIILGHAGQPALGTAPLTALSLTNSNAGITGAQSAALPSAALKQGELYRLWFSWAFVHTAAATPQLQFTLGILGVDLSLTVTPIATAATYFGECEGRFTVVTTGTGGTVRRALFVRGYGIQAANQWGGGASVDVANVTVNQNVASNLTLRANMVTAVAGNTLTLSQGTCERPMG